MGHRLRLTEAFRTPDTKRLYTRRLFATIADRYDLITRVLSFGRDQAWKARLIDRAGIRPGFRVLDLACGTGDLAFRAAALGASVVGLDFTPRMIALAVEKREGRAVRWVVGDMGRLPVLSSRFDLVTTGYGLRNVPDLETALVEIFDVLAPGGRLCSLDFNPPESSVVRGVYLTYLTIVGSLLGMMLHGDPDTYRYIPASIRRYPGARGVAAMMRDTGFSNVDVIPVFGGFMAIHVATKPA